jgi:hypothetical protein
MIQSIKSFFSTYSLQLLGGALAVSLLANVGLGVAVDHYAGKAASCVTAVEAVNKQAEATKKVVEVRQEKNVVKTQDRTSNRIAAAADSLRRESRKPNNGTASPTPESPAGEGGTPVVLPAGTVTIDAKTYEADKLICVTNTIKAEEWQNFYQEQLDIWDEEYDRTDR